MKRFACYVCGSFFTRWVHWTIAGKSCAGWYCRKCGPEERGHG